MNNKKLKKALKTIYKHCLTESCESCVLFQEDETCLCEELLPNNWIYKIEEIGTPCIRHHTTKGSNAVIDKSYHCRYCGSLYGYINYPEWVETYEDTQGCNFESGCMYGLENTIPTAEEEKEFEEWYNRTYNMAMKKEE